jgi:putative ABC transport system permease protein
LPASHVDDIRVLPGVAKASAHVYLASLSNASCCSVSDMFLVAFEPETDFTVQPWIEEASGASGLEVGHSLGGSLVTVPDGEPGITLYGYPLTLSANLAPTGTNLDRSLFITMDTARAMASRSVTSAVSPLELREGSVSAVLVKVSEGSDAAGVASLIEERFPDVDAIPETGLFGESRRSMELAFRSLLALLGVSAGFALIFIALVSAMAAHERRRETGVLRALGVTRLGVIGVQLVQSAALTAGGGLIGIGIAALITYLFRDLLIARLGFPFLYPGAGELAVLALGGIALLVAGVSVAVAIPTGLASLGEPADTMRS